MNLLTIQNSVQKLDRVFAIVLPVHHVQALDNCLSDYYPFGADWCQKLLWRVRRRGLGRVGGITARNHKFRIDI